MTANSVDPDQTAPFKEQSDLGLHCLLSFICPDTLNFLYNSLMASLQNNKIVGSLVISIVMDITNPIQ